MEKITVIIPAYNAENYINKCIQSLENQTRKDFKILIIDDCSKDNTVDLVQQLQSNSNLNITLYKNKVNKGPAYSRNMGIQLSNTDFITFCDSDDWYDPNYIEEMSDILEKTEADIVFCGYKIVNDFKVEAERPLTSKRGIISESEAYSLDTDSLCMMMVKTKLMKNTLLPDIRNGEDVATVALLLAKANKISVSNKCLYNYYRRAGSASETPQMNTVDSLIESYRYTENNYPNNKKDELEYLGIKNLLYSTIITLFSFSYDIRKAKSILDQFEIKYPGWYYNKYYHCLSKYKKLILFFVKYRMFVAIKAIACLRNYLIKS